MLLFLDTVTFQGTGLCEREERLPMLLGEKIFGCSKWSLYFGLRGWVQSIIWRKVAFD